MAAKDRGTEQLIKDTAKRVFFAEGKLHATTQDIADAAGVNRTLLNYYFRSRDILFDIVAAEARAEMSNQLDQVFVSPIAFKEKLHLLIQVFMEQVMKFPYREMYVISNFIRTENAITEGKRNKIKNFLNEISLEMESGKITKMDPRQFCFNLFALMAHPLMNSHINKSLYGIDDKDYQDLMNERKELIFQMIYK